ncbi:acyl-CoA thioesterase [Sediminivirga luteola]|uniref:Acyl-CoA thioesterase 2 n=1 Tax=Sediminivirga luteola TaxID=1774748 RepID=A0A8J2TZM3_9MICO|nr:acyl-CoA thioesterase II [Sediminivirga luteola]GGA20908.1 acyl-CoA thioesterase II [Sediminivirga luteola]
MNDENTRDLLRTLDLHPVSESAGPEAERFSGPSQYKPDGRVFGGQVLAQCIVAATRTVDPGRFIHSMHGYFLRAGDVAESIDFGVDRLRDGGSFSARRVQAYQKGKPIMSMIASFQLDQPGYEHAAPMPDDVPDPEDLPDIAELLGRVNLPHVTDWVLKRPFDYRPVEAPLYGRPAPERSSLQRIWFRGQGQLPGDRGLHAAILAYASDFSLLEPTLRKAGLTWLTPGLRMASIDHAMWFHRPVRADEWMLYVQESPSAENGRGLGLGRIYQRDGALLATVGQQGVVRIPEV